MSRLAEDTVNRMFTTYQDLNLRKLELNSIWYFYKCYNLSIAFLGIEDKDASKKNKAFSKLLDAVASKDFYRKQKYLQEVIRFIHQDIPMINKMMAEIGEVSNLDTDVQNKLWGLKMAGIPVYDVQ